MDGILEKRLTELKAQEKHMSPGDMLRHQMNAIVGQYIRDMGITCECCGHPVSGVAAQK